jgi:hypothetical protein
MTQKRFLAIFSTVLTMGLIIIACSQKPEPPPSYIAASSRLFTSAANCASCHTGQEIQDQNGMVSTSENWQSSMMANSATDPYFQASVSKEVQTHPEHQEEIEDSCATCHMPMARAEDFLLEGQQGKILQDGYLNPDHPLFAMAMDGVSCVLCHQIEDVNLNNERSFTGQFVIDPAFVDKNKPAYGPYGVPPGLTGLMADASGYQPRQSAHIQSSELCATCHTLFTTPVVQGQQRSDLQFPEQTPYLEWEASSYNPNTSCQDCHMPVINAPVRLTNTPGPFRNGYSSHTFTSANAFMLNLFQTFNQELSIIAPPSRLEEAIAETDAFLSTRTLTLAMDAEIVDNVLLVTLDLQSLSGHKFPSGYPSRRAWIHLTALGENNQVLFESGAIGPDGNIHGNANDENPLAFEPHYEEITAEDQVQIYESIMGDFDGNITTELLTAVTYLKDNRLLPDGFDKFRVFDMIAVQGNALGDADFNGGGDVITYRINLDEGLFPKIVIVEILFQPVSFRWIENFRGINTPMVVDFLGYADAAGNAPSVIATQTLEIMPDSD